MMVLIRCHITVVRVIESALGGGSYFIYFYAIVMQCSNRDPQSNCVCARNFASSMFTYQQDLIIILTIC